MKTIMDTLKLVIVTFLVLAVIGTIGSVAERAVSKQETSRLNQQAVDNTAKNAAKASFITGCTEEGAAVSACGCAFDALDRHYGYKWYEDQGLINRIETEGYNLQETQAIQTCVAQTQVN